MILLGMYCLLYWWWEYVSLQCVSCYAILESLQKILSKKSSDYIHHSTVGEMNAVTGTDMKMLNLKFYLLLLSSWLQKYCNLREEHQKKKKNQSQLLVLICWKIFM